MRRGEIYYITFPHTFDKNFPEGKKKFVVVLQEGREFDSRDTVTVLLITSDPAAKDHIMSVTIELGSTDLDKESYILCSQPYTIEKNVLPKKAYGVPGN
jgi:mRNA-degrading endonuclease toxin of MazEF toxin-antitoxin module